MSKTVLVLRMSLGGAACGCFAGALSGGVLGLLGGLVTGAPTLGLDAAVFAGLVLGLLGGALGLALGVAEARHPAPPTSIDAVHDPAGRVHFTRSASPGSPTGARDRGRLPS